MGVLALDLPRLGQGGVHVWRPGHLHVLDQRALLGGGDVNDVVLAQHAGQDLVLPLIWLGLILRGGQDLVGQRLGGRAVAQGVIEAVAAVAVRARADHDKHRAASAAVRPLTLWYTFWSSG